MFDENSAMRHYGLFLAILFLSCNHASTTSCTVEVNASPVVGDVGMRSARVWCQLSAESHSCVPTVSLLDSTGQRLHVVPMQSMELGNCFQVELSNLAPGTRYSYYIGDDRGESVSDTLFVETQPLWQYRTDPPELNFLVGSCTYVNEPAYDRPGKPYGGGYGIFDTMSEEDFEAMLWLGDNIYLREVDFGSLSGFVHRYTHTRSLPEMQSLLSKGAHYAIWDDHDFGPNDCDGSWIHPDWSRATFDAFWPNPASGIPAATELNTTHFLFGDVEFFPA